MGTSSAITTRLDEEMLALHSAFIFPPHTPISAMPSRAGASVAIELANRYLLRYLVRSQYSRFSASSAALHFTTPTPYSPTEAISWLALPSTTPRDHVVFLDPAKLSDIRGPRRILLGGGIEYILASGFPASALVVPWPLPVL